MRSEWAKYRGSGKIEDRHIHEIYSGRSEKNKKLYDLQGGIQTHHPWTGQPRAVRIRTNVQHYPLPFVLQTYACGICLRPDQDTIRKLKHYLKPWLWYTALPVLTAPQTESAVNPNGEEITWKRRTPQEQRWKMARILPQSGGNRMSSTENRRWPTDGLRSTANIWITSRRLILTTRPRGTNTQIRKYYYKRSSMRTHE